MFKIYKTFIKEYWRVLKETLFTYSLIMFAGVIIIMPIYYGITASRWWFSGLLLIIPLVPAFRKIKETNWWDIGYIKKSDG